MDNLNSTDKNKKEVSLKYSQKWLWLGIVIALISPIAGIVLAIAFLNENELKKEAKIILGFAIIWGICSVYLLRWMTEQGYMPDY